MAILATVIDEWTADREAGGLGFRLVQDGDGGIWLEIRMETLENGVWTEWMEEDLDGFGNDVLERIPALLAAESARIRRGLLEEMGAWLSAVTWRGEGVSERQIGVDAALAAFQGALDRICPEGRE